MARRGSAGLGTVVCKRNVGRQCGARRETPPLLWLCSASATRAAGIRAPIGDQLRSARCPTFLHSDRGRFAAPSAPSQPAPRPPLAQPSSAAAMPAVQVNEPIGQFVSAGRRGEVPKQRGHSGEQRPLPLFSTPLQTHPLQISGFTGAMRGTALQQRVGSRRVAAAAPVQAATQLQTRRLKARMPSPRRRPARPPPRRAPSRCGHLLLWVHVLARVCCGPTRSLTRIWCSLALTRRQIGTRTIKGTGTVSGTKSVGTKKCAEGLRVWGCWREGGITAPGVHATPRCTWRILAAAFTMPCHAAPRCARSPPSSCSPTTNSSARSNRTAALRPRSWGARHGAGAAEGRRGGGTAHRQGAHAAPRSLPSRAVAASRAHCHPAPPRPASSALPAAASSSCAC